MKKFLTKNKKYLGLVLIAVIASGFVFLPIPVSAAWYNPGDWFGSAIGWIGGRVVLFISSFISMILATVFGVIIGLEAQIIDYILSPSNFSFTSAPIVTLGWGITRDLANMFFILILLIIAFATVLKIQSYAIKQLWWKVIVAALLINFSLVIAGFVIDFTQVLTAFFLNQITGGGSLGTITTKLAASMQILNFYNPATPTSVLEGIADFGASSIAAIIGIILTLIGLVITVFVFGAAMIFLIVRILYLWLLLIFAPIVWMLWILPATSGYFSRWWHSFIQWAFFAPIFVFMIYLSLSIFDATGKLSPKVFGVFPAAWQTPAPGLTTVGMPAAIFQWILVIAMMFGSLIVAQKFGVYGAAASQKMLKGWGTNAKNWAGRRLRSGYLGWTKPEEPGVQPQTGVRGLLKKVGTNVGVIAAATPGLRGTQLKMLEDERKSYDNTYNKYKNTDPAVLDQIKLLGSGLEPRELTAIKQILIEKGKYKPHASELPKILDQARKYGKEEDILKLVSDKMKRDLTAANGYGIAERTELLQRAKRYGNEKDFLKFFPNLAPAIGKSIKDTVSKIEKAADIYEDQLVTDVVRELNPSQLKDIGKNGNDAQRRAAKIAVIQDYRGLSLSDRQNIRIVSFEKNIQKREELRKSLPENLRKMSYMREITTAPAWEHNL